MSEYGSALFDRRQYPRLDAEIPFAYEVSEQTLPGGLTANISLGGLLVMLPQRQKPGDILELTIHLPAGEKSPGALKVRAEVVWSQPVESKEGWSCQAGLRFFEMPPESFLVWREFLAQWYQRR